MRTRTLGFGGPVVAEIGLGTMGMGGSYGPVDKAESLATLRLALDSGVTLIDTADFYGQGASEELVGKAVAGRRDEAVVATKTGMRFGPGGPRPDGSPEFIKAQLDGSLRRLGVDHVDLYYLARVDPQVPIEDSAGALAELVAAGKVRHIGLCEAAPSTLRRAAKVHRIAALQTEYSLWERGVEQQILPTLRELGIALVAYRTLGSGFLSGKVALDRLDQGDWRRNDPRLQGENLDRNLEIVSVVREVAERRNLTAAQLALAWVLSRGPDVIAIPGTKNRRYLRENLAAADVRIAVEESAELLELVPHGAAGQRYQPALMKTIDA
ncbi:aldo/keto reductase [Saccharopolyspora phatthalungensis]|uniref:Aryl-alcohol dehydrogenase-like predicted oxidoreductase n=1 Tax=Saccharopolyspora phatthalungensis TaxID=664693 RepID=A0A840QDW8_9PSEU|nr:aldo/keto reductase [Saccharopolyspora phatthalungensis]MBB5158020.1 aryl-alcohol dehydrogenase-like predicted oxidoreductase [Saccharopolyspora phatthalungensis]